MNDFTRGELFILYWQYDHSCHLLGDFSRALIGAITRADSNNLERLALGFPEEIAAYRHFAETRGWWDKLEERAAKHGFPVRKNALEELGDNNDESRN